MTTFTINPRVTPDPTNFTVTGTVGGVTLKWAEANDDEAFGAEVWSSTTNNRANATKIAEVAVGSYYHELAAGSTRYYWIRGKNTYGYTTGNWVPASATGGVVGISPGANTADIAVGAVTNVQIYDDGETTTLIGAGSYLKVVKIAGTGSKFIIDMQDAIDYDINIANNDNYVNVNTQFVVLEENPSYPGDPLRAVGGAVAGDNMIPIRVGKKGGDLWTKYAYNPSARFVVTLQAGKNYLLCINQGTSYDSGGTGASLVGTNIIAYSNRRVITVTELKR